MKESMIAKIYAQSALDLAQQTGIEIADELTKITELINSNNDLENILFLGLFTKEEKKEVLKIIVEKSSISKLTSNFLEYLILEDRINLLPLIIKEVIVIDDSKKGFMRGVIEGVESEVGSEVKEQFTKLLATKIGVKPALEYEQVDNITAGYKVTVGDIQIDASIDNQLEKFKMSVFK